MTENEAIVFIKNANELSKKAICDLEKIKNKAERIGKIGEYYANLENCYKEIESCDLAIKALEEIQQYRAIGTVEECREARERQRGKKPNKSDVQPYFRKHCDNIYSCPLCNKKLTYHKQKFCQYCGQAIDWSE